MVTVLQLAQLPPHRCLGASAQPVSAAATACRAVFCCSSFSMFARPSVSMMLRCSSRQPTTKHGWSLFLLAFCQVFLLPLRFAFSSSLPLASYTPYAVHSTVACLPGSPLSPTTTTFDRCSAVMLLTNDKCICRLLHSCGPFDGNIMIIHFVVAPEHPSRPVFSLKRGVPSAAAALLL